MSDLAGVVVVDKPGGMTSHDVVGRVRRLLGTRRVGHAGTLDPMATGVLVVLVGEATKLAGHLALHDKRYVARVAFGRATDTLDAEGRTTRADPPPAWLLEELRLTEVAGRLRRTEVAGRLGELRLTEVAGRLGEALALERARVDQVPPAFSAIQVEGRRSYDRARAGEDVALPPRPVAVHAIVLAGAAAHGDDAASPPVLPPGEPWVDLELHVGKGYYVRSLARDLGERLGVPAHLAALRRTASGPFTLAQSVRLDAGAEAIRAALVPLPAAAAAALPSAVLTAEGTLRARRGQRLSADDFAAPPPAGEAAWLDPDGLLVAVGSTEPAGSATNPGPETRFAVVRGFGA